jgi:hypothetical protein
MRHEMWRLMDRSANGAAILRPIAAFVVWYGMRPYAASVVRARAWV